MRVYSRSITRILLSSSIVFALTASGYTLANADGVTNNLVTQTGTLWDTNFLYATCGIVPNVCSTVRQIKERFLPNTGEFQARGPKDLIAIISTMLASLLGAILVKLNVLIVLSLISVFIGKLLLLMLALKTKIFSADHSHQHHQPIVYEKVYYPRHRTSHEDEYPYDPYQKYPPVIYS